MERWYDNDNDILIKAEKMYDNDKNVSTNALQTEKTFESENSKESEKDEMLNLRI